jgi:hypothetical protein
MMLHLPLHTVTIAQPEPRFGARGWSDFDRESNGTPIMLLETGGYAQMIWVATFAHVGSEGVTA